MFKKHEKNQIPDYNYYLNLPWKDIIFCKDFQ